MFFLLAVMLPSGLLVLLTLRMLVQDRELAEKRAADERRRLAADIRQELLSRVEQIRLTARSASDSASGNVEPQEVALLARVEAGRLVLPWEADAEARSAASAPEEPRFQEAIAAGEQHEFVGGRFDEAAAAYGRAVHIGRLRVQKATAQHFSARALTKGGHAREADRAYRAMLDVSPEVRDDQGIPFVFYAIRHLASSDHSSASDASAALRLLSQAVALPSLTPAAIYMAQDLRSELKLRAGDVAHSTADALGGVIARRIRDAEQALELQRAFPMIALPGRGAEPVWTTFGPPENVWLVNAARVGAPVVTAVRAALVIGSLQTPSRVPGNRTVVIGSADGEPLTPNFLGLAVSLPEEAAAALAAESRLPQSFYLVALALVVSIALFGGHLFWRDVRREVRMADLRSQFVSSVSHELKTPLTAIRMFAETLLLGRARPEVRQEYLETIVNESERLTRLLNAVLDFSKIEQGKKTYRLEPHSPDTIIRAAVKAHAVSRHAAGIRFARAS